MNFFPMALATRDMYEPVDKLKFAFVCVLLSSR